MESYKYFKNEKCEYFPCHDIDEKEFNCLFCYCPLYALGDECGGNFTFIEDGIKDCSKCTVVHTKTHGWNHVQTKINLVTELGKDKK